MSLEKVNGYKWTLIFKPDFNHKLTKKLFFFLMVLVEYRAKSTGGVHQRLSNSTQVAGIIKRRIIAMNLVQSITKINRNASQKMRGILFILPAY